MRALSFLGLLAAALLCAGCPDNFEKQSQITHLRVLGVQAEPAELILAADAGLPATTLTALAVEPSGAVITTRFALCLIASGLPSPSLDCPGDAGVDLPGDAGPLSARLDLNDPQIQAAALTFAANFDGGPGDAGSIEALLAQGVPVVIGFDVRAPAYGNSDGGPPPAPGLDVQRILGLATVPLRTASDARPINHNPGIQSILAAGSCSGLEQSGHAAGDNTCAIELNEDGGTSFLAGTTVTLTPIPVDDAAEPTPDGPEKLNFSFYSTAGDLSALRSTGTTATGQGGDIGVDYTAPTFSGVARIWIVVRDGRGGTGWIERRVNITQ